MTQDEAEKFLDLFKEYIQSVVKNDFYCIKEIESELVQRIVTMTGGVMGKPENVKCPLCAGPMKPRDGQYGKFWGCSRYPNCKGTRDSMGRSKEEREAEKENQTEKSPQDYQESEKQENHTAFSFNKK